MNVAVTLSDSPSLRSTVSGTDGVRTGAGSRAASAALRDWRPAVGTALRPEVGGGRRADPAPGGPGTRLSRAAASARPLQGSIPCCRRRGRRRRRRRLMPRDQKDDRDTGGDRAGRGAEEPRRKLADRRGKSRTTHGGAAAFRRWSVGLGQPRSKGGSLNSPAAQSAINQLTAALDNPGSHGAPRRLSRRLRLRSGGPID